MWVGVVCLQKQRDDIYINLIPSCLYVIYNRNMPGIYKFVCPLGIYWSSWGTWTWCAWQSRTAPPAPSTSTTPAACSARRGHWKENIKSHFRFNESKFSRQAYKVVWQLNTRLLVFGYYLALYFMPRELRSYILFVTAMLSISYYFRFMLVFCSDVNLIKGQIMTINSRTTVKKCYWYSDVSISVTYIFPLILKELL